MRSGRALIDAARRGELTETLARRLYAFGPEAVTLALLAATERIAELQRQAHGLKPSPSTPSGMVPIYAKQNKAKRHKKPGAREGHPGHRRKTPVWIDKRETHRLQRCPCCGGALQRCKRKRTRIAGG